MRGQICRAPFVFKVYALAVVMCGQRGDGELLSGDDFRRIIPEHGSQTDGRRACYSHSQDDDGAPMPFFHGVILSELCS